MNLFWKWLFFGPPLRTEPCTYKLGSTWYLSLPQEQDLSAKAVRKVFIAWSLIALLGLGVLIATGVSRALREYISGHNPSLIVGCGLALMVAGFVLSLRFSRERVCKEVIVGDKIGTRWYKIFFGFDWIAPVKNSHCFKLGEVKAIWRDTRRVYAETFDGNVQMIVECGSDNLAQWVYSQLSERLVQSIGSKGIRWMSNHDSIRPQYEIGPVQSVPWNVIESPERLEIVLPTPTQTPLSSLQFSMNRGKKFLKVGAFGMIASLIGILAIQVLGRLWPENSLGLFLQVAIVPYLTLAIATFVTFLAYYSISDGNQELPMKIRATKHMTTRIIADTNGLTRTNALNEEERIERITIQKIQYDFLSCSGDESSYHRYTLNALLHSGDKVFLVEYGSSELDESRYFMNFLVMRLEQALNLPSVSSPLAPAS